MRPGSRLRQIGWAMALSLCATLFVILSFRVNAVKSDVRLAEREIIALKRETTMLEIEFQTRASQEQLTNFNRVEYGYKAPRADQYLENERQLASLGLPRHADTPNPIRVARAPDLDDDALFPEMVNPLTGAPMGEGRSEQQGKRETGNQDQAGDRKPMNAPQTLSERLARETRINRPVAEISE